jgi:hypothetical protein
MRHPGCGIVGRREPPSLRARLASLAQTYPRLRWAAFIGIFAVGIAVRAVRIGEWPIGFRPTLDYDSANATRTIYLTLTTSHPSGWQQVWLQTHPGRFLEPPILQTLTALTYLPDGIERPWTAVVFTTVAWLVASALLFSTIRRLTDWSGSLLGLAYILLAPFGVAMSQSFQPEPLVLLSLSTVIWYAMRGDVLSGRRFAVAALIGAVAGLVKPGTLLFFIAAVYVVSAWQGGSLLDRRRLVRLAVLLALTALPAIVYALIWIPNQVDSKILPQLWISRSFYVGWGKNVLRAVGAIPLLGAGLGYVLTRRLWPLGIGLGVAYLGYSATFPYHAMTHDYYQLPMLLMVTIGLGGLGSALAQIVQRGSFRRGLAVAVALGVAVVLTFALAPRNLYETPPGTFPDAPRFQAIGQRLGAGEQVLTYSPNYGKPLMYYGKLLVTFWPNAGDEKFYKIMGLPGETADSRLAGFITTVNPHYFVITVDLGGIPALVDFLDARYALVESDTNLRIYDLTRPLQPRIPSATANPALTAP